MWTDRVDVFVATQSRVNHGPGGSWSGFLPVERCQANFPFPIRILLENRRQNENVVVRRALYSNSRSRRSTRAISTPTSTILTSSNSATLVQTSPPVIISSNIFEFIGPRGPNDALSPVFVHVFARSVGQRPGENRANLSFIRIRGRHDLEEYTRE